MYTVVKELTFSAAHAIRGHTGGCQNLHGHNYRVRIHVASESLDDLGMVIDFAHLKALMREVLDRFDHEVLNDVPPFDTLNTTAELLAGHVATEVAARLPGEPVRLARVEVWETDTSYAIFEP